MNPETNKSIVMQYIEMWNTGNAALADEVLAPTYVDHAHPEATGPASVKQAMLAFRSAFPDFHINIVSIIGEGDMVALRCILTRTQQGKEIVSHIMWFVRIADGKMVDLWTGSEASS